MTDMHDVAIAYVAKYKDSPPLSGLPVRLHNQAADLMLDAIERDEPLSEEEFYEELGLQLPPPGAKT